MAALALVEGCTIGLFGDHRLGSYVLYDPSFTVSLIRSLWGGLLICVGIVQLVALHVGGFGPQRWAAFLATAAWVALAYTCIIGDLWTMGVGTSVMGAVGEFAVFGMLRGARWRR